MEEKLDFSLPEKKQKTNLIPAIIIILLLVIISLMAVDLLKSFHESQVHNNSVAMLSRQQVKELATKLASRNLHTQAAQTWQEYLSYSQIDDNERAKTLFQIGTLLEKDGKYEDAIKYYYRSEITAELSELEKQINVHIKDCFQRLGKFSALRYELMDRTSFDRSDKAGSKIIAEIGAEKITESDLDAVIEQAIDNQLGQMAAFMTIEQLNEQKKKILEQYKEPFAKQEFLQTWLTQEILYRKALEEKLSEQPQAKSMIEDMVRGILSRQVMNNELAGKVNITEDDLQTYYQANKDKYIEPAKEDDPNSVERQKSFDEVRQQVMSELAGQKRQDVQQQLIKQLMDKYNVIIHTSAFAPAISNEDEE